MCQSYLDSNERMEPTDDKPSALNNRDNVGSSMPAVNPEQVCSTHEDVLGSQEAPSTKPTILLTSSDSCVSNYSDYSVDLGPHDGLSREESGVESGPDDATSKQVNENVNSSSLISESNLQQSDDLKDNRNDRNSDVVDTNELDGRGKNTDESEGGAGDEVDDNSPSYDDQLDIWLPPDAENEHDNVENSMAALDEEDDDCTDGDASQWAMPSSLSSNEGDLSSNRFKEDKQNAIEEVMNGKFKNLVSQLLRKVGIENGDCKDESWVDTVTLLAWQAASFVKPDAADGKAMDPSGYVKIKCVAAGSRGDSRVIKGLVFKKHAAHKHMSTKYKNPRLLLVKGALEPSVSSGLSSFKSLMVENKDDLADLVENLQTCQPNVILVEKSASRDVLQKVLDLELTLVLDMKLHRLERVARCTGSPILTSDKPFSTKLKQCESLYFEKIVEEHAIVGEGGKKPCKTLMFLEGCPTRRGCTILLKGSHSEELKKIKCVVQCAVVMAYHFLLETSFLVDQEAMFSTIAYQNVADNFLEDEKSKSVSSEIAIVSHTGDANAEVEVRIANFGNGESSPEQESPRKIPNGDNSTEAVTSNGVHDEASHNMQSSIDGSNVCNDPHMTTLSTPSSSIHDVLEKVSYVSPATFEDVSTYIDLNQTEPRSQNAVSDTVSPSKETPEEYVLEVKNGDKDDMLPHNDPESVSGLVAPEEVKGVVDDGEDGIRPKDEISTLLDSESILVLLSSRNAMKGTICEQSHFSHIKFYRHFDVPLGKFLRDNLFQQTVSCKTCNELPEAHFYYYAHHSKQLTIKVKRLRDEIRLPGEQEGKLWMWSRCGKCPPSKEKATKRVLISKAARGLSFGKFLELSFSSHSSFNRLSSCGHSFQKDFLYFFGLGSMVAMFRYSRVTTYTVSVPSQKLEFNSSINVDWLQKEVDNVYTKGLLLFAEVANYMKKLESRFSGQNLAVNGSLNGFTDILDMLKLEKSEFEENIKNTGIKSEKSHNTVHKLLKLNRLRWEILLEACVWERRLHSLISSLSTMPRSTVNTEVAQNQKVMSDSVSVVEKREGPQTAVQEVLQEETSSKEQVSSAEVDGTQKLTDEAVQEQAESLNTNIEGTAIVDSATEQIVTKESVSDGENKTSECTTVDVHIEEVDEAEDSLVKHPSEGTDCAEVIEENLESQTPEDSVANVSLLQEPVDNASEAVNIPIQGDNGDVLEKESCERVISPPLPKTDSKTWVWNPFSEIREECMADLHRGHLPKFGHVPKFVLLNSPDFSPALSEVILEEGLRLHVPLKDGDYIVSDFEGEISSSVACALTVLKDRSPPATDRDENATLKRAASEPSPIWAANGFLDPDVIQYTTSMSFAEHFPNFDGLNNLDSLVSYGQIHPEVTLGVEKYPMKGKYSVVVIYANEFRVFREQCCPSEVDYIASLSRCKVWDAKGGKSKSLFAKTLDDRLIIKEIKKTEFESFMKFAPGYFQHMKDSIESGNQTCLAKILGIYQVSVRNPKSGRESKHDLVVMENLSFGRSIKRQYDLKGALHARFTAGDGTDDVLLDQNFVNDMNASPIYIGQRAKRLLQRAVWNDTTFLNSINVMDYSLLVGVDRKRQELLCGIIDYLRQYTWDKQLETWVKTSLVMPKNVTPTIISPESYKKRFRKFMGTHFLTVPDHWCSQRSSNPCKLCGIKTGNSVLKTEKQEELNGFQALD